MESGDRNDSGNLGDVTEVGTVETRPDNGNRKGQVKVVVGTESCDRFEEDLQEITVTTNVDSTAGVESYGGDK